MWMRALALAAAALFLLPFVYPLSPAWGGLLVLLAGVASVVALVDGLRARPLRLPSRDPYDLGELRRVHEDEAIQALHGEGPLDLDHVLCPCCLTEYPARLGACPRCGRCG